MVPGLVGTHVHHEVIFRMTAVPAAARRRSPAARACSAAGPEPASVDADTARARNLGAAAIASSSISSVL